MSWDMAAKLVISLLVPDGEPVEVLIDDTLFRRRGKRVWAASWFHDGSAPGTCENGLREQLGGARRPGPAAHDLPSRGGAGDGETGDQGHDLGLAAVAGPPHGHPARRGLPGRLVHVTADSAYAGEELKQLPDGVTWTTRLRSNAALYDLPPERTGKKGRPRVKGDRLPSLAKIAAAAVFSQVTVTRYGKTEAIAVHAFTCLWYSVTGIRPVTVILIRDKSNRTTTWPSSPRKRTRISRG